MTDALSSTRRHFLGRGTGFSLGAIAMNALQSEASASGVLEQTHFPAKAKRVIYLTQSGGPSQIELFDWKPGLAKLEGTTLPDSIRNGQRLTTMTANQKQIVMGPRARFRQHGQSGAFVGEWLPHIGSVADDLCFIKSMYSEYINHAPAMTFMLTGHQIPGRPSMGAWASYGLGSENRNLPDYIVLVSKMQRPSGGGGEERAALGDSSGRGGGDCGRGRGGDRAEWRPGAGRRSGEYCAVTSCCPDSGRADSGRADSGRADSGRADSCCADSG